MPSTPSPRSLRATASAVDTSSRRAEQQAILIAPWEKFGTDEPSDERSSESIMVTENVVHLF